MKVSVIIPVYNTEEYLTKCLDSLVKQTLEEIEILVVDDGSTDGSVQIAREFEQAYPQKVKVMTKENGGQASARNMALKYATGEFLGFVDSDDWVDPTMYEELYDTATRENADMVICDMEDHFPDRVLYHHTSQFENKFQATGSSCNKFFKRELVGEDTFPVGLWYEDFEFSTKQMMKTEKVAVVHKAFYHCHCREVSTMSNNNALKNLDIVAVMENLSDFVVKNGWQEKYGDVLEYLYLDHILITSINRVQRQTAPERKMVMRKMRKAVKAKYPRFYRDPVFRQMATNRKIVALLNGAGLSGLSQILVDLKSKTK